MQTQVASLLGDMLNANAAVLTLPGSHNMGMSLVVGRKRYFNEGFQVNGLKSTFSSEETDVLKTSVFQNRRGK